MPAEGGNEQLSLTPRLLAPIENGISRGDATAFASDAPIRTTTPSLAMAQCECLPGCPFFNDKMPDSTGLGKIYKDKYCLGDNANCARHMVMKALGKPAVPANLYPNMRDVAQNLIKQGKPA